MLIPLPCRQRYNVKAVNEKAIFNKLWRATTIDPQFEYSIMPGLPFVLFQMRSQSLLKPAIYMDFGDGFTADSEIVLRDTCRGLYVIDLKSFRPVRRLRFDPSMRADDEFHVRAAMCFSAAAARIFVGRALQNDFHRNSGKNPEGRRMRDPADTLVSETIIGEKPSALSGFGVQAGRIRNIRDHFNQVTAITHQHLSQSIPTKKQSDSPVPKLSFIAPVYNTSPAYLDDLLKSFQIQRAGVWELLLCDDGSTRPETLQWLEAQGNLPEVRILRNAHNGGIASASNLGLAQARADWVGFIDHDDALAPFALDRVLEALDDNPHAQFLYTDEVIADGQLCPQGYFLKPAFDPVLLSGMNYLNHLSIYRRERLLDIGGFGTDVEGSQDYDLALRYLAGLPAAALLHLPYPAYIWRRDGTSYSVAFLERATASARRALGRAYADVHGPARVGPALSTDHHRILFREPDVWPKVSIIIPNRNAFALISRLLQDLSEKTDYPDPEIIIVDNGSDDSRVLALYDDMARRSPHFSAHVQPEPFNFSRQVNRGMALAQGEAILLLNNDVEIIEAGWLKEIVSCLNFPGTGIVGARLLYPAGTLQHAGVIVGLGSVAGHWHCGAAQTEAGPMSRLNVRQSFSAVTGACQLITRACYEAVGGYNEQDFAVAYNDIDFCLRAGEKGFRCVWTPFATLRHHESATRGDDETPANIARFRKEQASLQQAYGLKTFADPAYNPWWTRDDSIPQLTIPASLPMARVWPPGIDAAGSGD